MNKLFYGDNLEVLRKHIKDGTVDLCYIDPPFNSKRNYNQIYNNIGTEDRAQAQAFVDTWTWDTIAEVGYAEIISNYNNVFTSQSINLILGLEKVLGKGSLLAYLISMTIRVAEIFRVLKPTGSFYFHCDPTASHYLKLIIDAIFCAQGGEYQNEIVWCYKERELSKKHYNKKHDIILFYTKTNNYTFNYSSALEEYSKGTIKKFNYTDEDGRKFQIRGKGGVYTGKQGLKLSLEETNPDDVYRDYLDKSLGILPRDWWDIPFINRAAKERLGYPTQKPEQLLQRIISVSSNENDVVLDAFCGCGTTVAVSERLNRKWIGIDITYQSISLILKRLEEHFGAETVNKIVLNGVPKDFESAKALAHKKDDRVRKEFEKWLVLAFSNNRAIINQKKGGDGGIDGISYMVDCDDEGVQSHKQIILSVKSNETLSPTVVRDLFGVIKREEAAIGFLLTLYPMDNLVKESKKYGIYNNTFLGQSYQRIEVVSVQEVLDGKRMKIPTALEVLKKAEWQKSEKQEELF